MKKFALFIAVVLLAGLLPSCEEDIFLEPTNVDLSIKLTGKGEIDDDEDDDAVYHNGLLLDKGSLSIEGGTLYLSEIEFDGTRKEADNYYFTKTFDNMLKADLEEDELNQNVTFNIPQGSYNPVKMTMKVSRPESDSSYGLTIRGEYETPSEEEFDVELRFFDYEELIELTLTDENGNKEILLQKSEQHTIEIQINVKHIFRHFNVQMLQQAAMTPSDNGNKIIISRNQNSNMYFDLATRIEKSTKAIIKERE